MEYPEEDDCVENVASVVSHWLPEALGVLDHSSMTCLV